MSEGAARNGMEHVLARGGEAGALIRAIDWSQSPLGPMVDWPQSLRTALSICLTSRFPILVWWGEARIQFYNDAYRPVLGASKHPHAMGAEGALIWPEIWHIMGPIFDGIMAGGPAVKHEDMFMFLDRYGFAEETFFSHAHSPIYGEDGEVQGVFTAVTETTGKVVGDRRLRTLKELSERTAGAKSASDVCKQAAAALAQNRADLPFVALYLVDDAGKVSPHASTGLTVDSEPRGDAPAIQQVVHSLESLNVPAHTLGQFGFAAHESLQTPGQAVVSAVAQPGDTRAQAVLLVGLSPHLGFDEQYRAFVSLIARQLATALGNADAYERERARAEQLAALDRAKTAFFSNVSHEFRTPLTLMIGPTEQALHSPGQTLAGEELARVYRNELRLLRLVNTLLDVSRIEAGRAQAAYVPTDLAALTRDLASAFESALARAQLQLEVDCDPDLPKAYVDREMWEKIVLNLISNAVKFTFHGAVRVALHAQDGALLLTVQDTGVGIPESELERIFDRFHRVSGTRSRSHEGSGIGLSLVRDLVTLHGGTIDVQSEVGRGSTFRVRIPTGRAHLPAEQVQTASEPGTHKAAEPYLAELQLWLREEPGDGELPQQRSQVLVVDDNPDMRQHIASLLRAQQFVVHTAADGEQALQLARALKPQLVLTDVMMPGLDGFGLLKALRSDAATAGTSVIMLSARAGEEARIEGLSAGADDYLVKPFSAKELLARVATQLKLAQLRNQAARSGARLHELFMQSPVAVSVLQGKEHRYELANLPYQEMVRKRELVGRTMAEVFPEVVDTPLMALFDHVFQTGEPFVAREYVTALDRKGTGVPEECVFQFNLVATRGDDGEVTGMMCTAVEITEQVRARRDAEGARAQAEQASRAKDEFLAMLGHELRNPLAPMLTALSLMRVSESSAHERERTILERQVGHLVRLVDDLLDVSRIARGAVDLRRRRVELHEPVTKAIEMASPLIEQRAHTLELDVPETGLPVAVDPERFAQVVANLLTNAAKYTNQAGRIEVSAALEGEQVVLHVRDNGVGIAPEMLPRVFDMFAQERQSLDRSQGGLGLGLAIVRSLVQAHGGSVQADSQGRGQGSVFSVRLPLSPGAIDAQPDITGTRLRAAPSDGRLRILIVDDNEDAADMLEQALRRMGHETRVAYEGLAALELVETFTPDLGLLDIGLPVMDGYELAGRLRARPELAQLPLVAITGYGHGTARSLAEAAGFDAHMVKPVHHEQLRALIGELSERKVARQA